MSSDQFIDFFRMRAERSPQAALPLVTFSADVTFPAPKADLKAYRDRVAIVQARIRAQVAAGKSVQEIVDSKPTKDFDERWGGGFIKPDPWVTMLATALRR